MIEKTRAVPTASEPLCDSCRHLGIIKQPNGELNGLSALSAARPRRDAFHAERTDHACGDGLALDERRSALRGASVEAAVELVRLTESPQRF